MTIRRLAWAGVLVGLLAGPGLAQEPDDEEEPSAESALDAGDALEKREYRPHRSNHFRSRTKVRSGSMIRRVNESPAARPDLRGELERQRDVEVIRHFERLAELDAIEKLAGDAGDAELVSRAEAVRRAELERFRLAMLRLRRVIQTRAQGGFP
jgi:hypothetical protein